MGTGGPSQAEREEQERLRQLQAQQLTQQQQYMATAAAPDPLAEALRKEDLDFLNFEQSKGADFDITKAPGMAANLDLFNRAKSKREGERMGIGVLQLGMNAANPELAARIGEQRQTEREQEAAGGLENAYNMRRAEVHGSVLPLVNQRQNQTMGLAGLSSNNANFATDAYTRFLTRPRRTPFWQQLLLSGAQGAGAAAGAGGGG